MGRGTRGSVLLRFWRGLGVLLLVAGILLASGCAGSWSVLFLRGPGKQYLLTIRYRFEDGSTTAPSYEALLREGEDYSVVSPEIGGFTASLPVVTGTMPAMDAIRNVIYTSTAVTEYTLTIASAPGGSVTVPGEGTHTYTRGTVVDLVAVAEEAHRFTVWTGDTATIGNLHGANTTVTMTGPLTVTANFEDAIFFPDPNLDQVVREAIGIPTGYLYRSDVRGLTELSAEGRGIINLEGLQHCVDLTRLYLSDNQLIDLLPLSGLPQLTVLWLGENQIIDLTPLAGLNQLTRLLLWSNPITDLKPLAGLSQLTWLSLSVSQITDLTPLAGLSQITMLDLQWNQITDLTPLAGLNQLTMLYLQYNEITDLTPLENLIQITDLDLTQNFLDLTPGSAAMQIIQDFLNRGAHVTYEPQRPAP